MNNEFGELHSLPLRQRIRVKLAGFVFQSLASLAPPYIADDCRQYRSLTVIFALLTPESVSFPEQTLGSGICFSTSRQKNMEQSAACTQTACMD